MVSTPTIEEMTASTGRKRIAPSRPKAEELFLGGKNVAEQNGLIPNPRNGAGLNPNDLGTRRELCRYTVGRSRGRDSRLQQHTGACRKSVAASGKDYTAKPKGLFACPLGSPLEFILRNSSPSSSL